MPVYSLKPSSLFQGLASEFNSKLFAFLYFSEEFNSHVME